MKRTIACAIPAVLAAFCMSLATNLQPRASSWSKRDDSGSVLNVLLGDGRRIFANHFFTEADVYLHSGYYPTIFDQSQTPKDTRHMTSKEGSPEEEAHEKQMDFLGEPKDWIERFGRHFMVTQHTHLSGGNEREILPWLELSADLDPHRIDTYTVAAYFLRSRLGKVAEAEQFLRQGLRANPNSYEILFELGKLYNEDRHDPVHARNLWEVALRCWTQQEAGKKDANLFAFEEIAVNLADLEKDQGNYPRAIELLQLAKKVSPQPQALEKQIQELREKMNATKPETKQ